MIVSSEEMYYEPIHIMDDLSDSNRAEMTRDGLAFLCGLIKKNKPQKIVEIGVAAGGTTAVIMNCVAKLGLQSELYSLDLSEKYYLDQNKDVGYLAQECKAILNTDLNYRLYTGKYAVENLGIIGENIDFLLLDTVHSMPGEILDFLAFLPYLRNGGIVVLHDITLNHLGRGNSYSYVTKVLFDVVSADKIINWDMNHGSPDIAAFIINEHTRLNIENVFSILTLTWQYMPEERELFLYKEWYRKHYSLKCLELFNISEKLNKRTFSKINQLKCDKFVEIYCCLKKCIQKKVYVYGYGNFGKQFYQILDRCGIELGGYIISDDQSRNRTDMNVFFLSELEWDNDRDIVFVGVNTSLYEKICGLLMEKGISYILPNENMFELLT